MIIAFDKKDFYNNPNKYTILLLILCLHADMLITGHYYAPDNPIILSKKDINHHD